MTDRSPPARDGARWTTGLSLSSDGKRSLWKGWLKMSAAIVPSVSFLRDAARTASHRTSVALILLLFGPLSGVFAVETSGAAAKQPAVAPPDVAAMPSVSWMFDASRTSWPERGGNVFLRVRIDTSKAVSKGRVPLNVAFVFDRSSSMNIDIKIGYLIKAGHLAADNLTAQDNAALITFQDEVQTLVPMHRVVNREYLHHRLDEIEADGYTNISAALMEGAAQLDSRLSAPGAHELLLLTDGQPTRGVTDANQLVDMVKRIHDRGITVSTIGVGKEYDETLLTRMAQVGGGRYSYVSQPDQIPSAIRNELGSMLAPAGQNAKLQLELPAGLTVDQVYGREEPITPGKVEIALGDLTTGVDRTLLIRLKSDGTGDNGTIRAVLAYDDMATSRREQLPQSLTLQGRVATVQPTEVGEYARLVDAVDKIALAVKSMDRALAADVLKFRQQQFPWLKQTAMKSADQEFVNKAFLFEHFSGELAELIEEGALHDHSEARAALQKDLQYRRYMMEHHAHTHTHSH